MKAVFSCYAIGVFDFLLMSYLLSNKNTPLGDAIDFGRYHYIFIANNLGSRTLKENVNVLLYVIRFRDPYLFDFVMLETSFAYNTFPCLYSLIFLSAQCQTTL